MTPSGRPDEAGASPTSAPPWSERRDHHLLAAKSALDHQQVEDDILTANLRNEP